MAIKWNQPQQNKGITWGEDTSKQRPAYLTGNQFEQKKPTSFLGKARDFTASVIGGGKLAQGLGQSIVAPKIQKGFEEQTTSAYKLQDQLLQRIKDKKKLGEDTSRLEKALKKSGELNKYLGDLQSDFSESLVSNKEVVGSALRLGGTLAGGALVSGVSKGKIGLQASKGLTRVGGINKLFGMGKATTFTGGALRGAGAGATAGAVEGAIHGAGFGLEENKDLKGVAKSSGVGALIGGATGGALGLLTGGITGKIRGKKTFQEETKKILETKPNSTVAKYKLSGEGKVVNDTVAKEAVKQGIDEGTVATIKGSSATDKLKMNKMLDILEEGKVDPKFAATNRPSDIVGDSVLERFTIVNKANQASAKQLNTVAKGLKGQTVDPTEAVQSFMSKLDDLGITFKKGKAIYSGSQIEGLTEPQKIIDTIVKRMNNVSDDAYEIHNLKKFIDEQVTYGKTSGGLAGRTEGILKGLRNNLDKILDKTFKKYNAVNTTYATTRNAIDDFITSAGTKFDPNLPNANARVGTLMRRILSNAQSRTNVLNAMQSLQEVAEANGGKFTDDVITQTVFVNDLERLFGTQAPTSLAGEVSKGVQKGIGWAGKLKSAGGIVDLVGQAGASGIDKLRNVNMEGLSQATRNLLR